MERQTSLGWLKEFSRQSKTYSLYLDQWADLLASIGNDGYFLTVAKLDDHSFSVNWLAKTFLFQGAIGGFKVPNVQESEPVYHISCYLMEPVEKELRLGRVLFRWRIDPDGYILREEGKQSLINLPSQDMKLQTFDATALELLRHIG